MISCDDVPSLRKSVVDVDWGVDRDWESIGAVSTFGKSP